MITIFNRKLLFRGNSAEESARVWSTLRKEGIPYTMKTTGMKTPFSRGLHCKIGIGMTSGASRYSSFADSINYIYSIYVQSKDYERAKQLLSY